MRDLIMLAFLVWLLAVFMPTLEQRWHELERPLTERHEVIKRSSMM